MIEPVKCKRCGSEPKVVDIQGCWYTYCHDCCCTNRCANGKVSMYEHLGATRKASIESWNFIHGKVQSDAQKNAIAKHKERCARIREEKERERAKFMSKAADNDRPKILMTELAKPKRLSDV